MLWQENWWEVVSTFPGVSRLRCIVASGYGCRFFLGMRFPVIPVKTWVLQFNCLVHSVYMRQCQLIVFRSVNSVSILMAWRLNEAVQWWMFKLCVGLLWWMCSTGLLSVFQFFLLIDPWFHLDWKREKNFSWETFFSRCDFLRGGMHLFPFWVLFEKLVQVVFSSSRGWEWMSFLNWS